VCSRANCHWQVTCKRGGVHIQTLRMRLPAAATDPQRTLSVPALLGPTACVCMRKMLSNFNNYRTGNSVPFIWHYPRGIALQMLKYTDLLPYLWPIGFYAKTSVMILLMDHSWNNLCRFSEPFHPIRNALLTSLQLSRALGHARDYSIVHYS
jgi:hypothetical protein